jgi:hypothetical protein
MKEIQKPQSLSGKQDSPYPENKTVLVLFEVLAAVAVKNCPLGYITLHSMVKSTYVSEEYIALIFMVELKPRKKPT